MATGFDPFRNSALFAGLGLEALRVTVTGFDSYQSRAWPSAPWFLPAFVYVKTYI
jgi:hypothetical protein